MSMLYTILTVLVVIASILITLIVLLQNGKGGGLASNFVAGNQTFGVRQTADILEKITWGLAIFIFALSILTVFVKPSESGKIKDYSDVTENINKQKQSDSELAIPDAATLPLQAEESADTDK